MIIISILLHKNLINQRQKILQPDQHKQIQQNLATKVNIDDFIEKTDFDGPKYINKKVTSNKTKHIEAENKLNDQTKKDEQISVKG